MNLENHYSGHYRLHSPALRRKHYPSVALRLILRHTTNWRSSSPRKWIWKITTAAIVRIEIARVDKGQMFIDCKRYQTTLNAFAIHAFHWKLSRHRKVYWLPKTAVQEQNTTRASDVTNSARTTPTPHQNPSRGLAHFRTCFSRSHKLIQKIKRKKDTLFHSSLWQSTRTN